MFLLSLLVGFSGAIVPGPLFAVTLQQALLSGWSAGIWLVCGHILAELCLFGILRAGLGGVLQRPLTTRVIGVVGGLVLLYFAWGMIAVLFTPSGLPVGAADAAHAMNSAMLVGQGVVLTVINPYWYLWWATAGIGMISTQAGAHGERAWPVFYLGHSLSDVLWYAAVSIALACSGTFLSPAIHRGMIAVSGLGVAILGVAFLYRPLSELTRRRRNMVAGIDKSRWPEENESRVEIR